MNNSTNRRKIPQRLWRASIAWLALPTCAQQNDEPNRPRRQGPGGGRGRRDAQDYVLPPELAAFSWLSLVLGRVSDRSVTVSALAKETIEGFFEYGTATGNYSNKTGLLTFSAGKPVETVFDKLQPNTQYFYRLQYRKPGEANFAARPECRFHTQRATGSTFTFAIQGDSHPERPQMSEPNLYARTLLARRRRQTGFLHLHGRRFQCGTGARSDRGDDWRALHAATSVSRLGRAVRADFPAQRQSRAGFAVQFQSNRRPP